MPDAVPGLHHVTAIASDPQRNLDYYTGLLGLRLVKRTVNFDDPGSYHLYFGDDAGSPGTILTFFAWPQAARGVRGIGETSAVAFSIAEGGFDFWERRLRAADTPVEREPDRFGRRVLAFADPDGTRLELIGDADGEPERPPRDTGIPPEHSIRGLSGVTLSEAGVEPTAGILESMGLRRSGEESHRYRLTAPSGAHGTQIDIQVQTQLMQGRMGAGTVHHIAFRAGNDHEQLAWRERLGAIPLDVTPVLDRTYFHSIYLREPGGVLLEITTDPPGFAADESPDSLGEALKLPAWLESKRPIIERHLPPIVLHRTGRHADR